MDSTELGERVREVRVRGEVDLSVADRLEMELLEHTVSHGTRLLVDLSDCSFIDSSGIRALLIGTRAAEHDDGNGKRLIVVVAPGTAVRRVLDLVGLSNFLGVVDTREDGVRLLTGSG